MPSKLSLPVLCDFGSAAWGEERHKEDAQPDIYWLLEAILKAPWSYEVDIWNVSCMVGFIWFANQ
jgi:serine/threonine-protein kinase SRPK3